MVLSDLNEGEISFRRLAENLPGIVYRVLIEDDNRMIFFNDMVQNMTGYSPDDLKKGEVCSIDPLILPEDKLNVINIVKDAIENNVPFEVEYRINTKSGELKWFFERGRTVRGDDGNPSYIDGVIFDITKSKEAEQKIIQEREKAKLYLNLVEVIIVALNVDGKITLMNKKGQELLGYEEGELIGIDWFEVCLPPHDRKRVYEYFKKLMAGELEVVKSYENSVWTKNGEEKLIAWSTFLFRDDHGNVTGLLSSGEDITKRKKAEMAVQRSEAQKTAILNAITTNIAFVNNNLEILWVNKASCDSVNKTPEEMIGHKCHKFWADPQEPCKRCPTLKAFKTKKTEHVIMITPDGRVWDEKGEPVFDNVGNLVGVIEIAHEITQKHQTERALQKSRASLARAQRIVHLGNWDWDVEKDDFFWSDELYRIFGLVPQEFNATYEAFLNSVHPEDREFVKKSVNEILYEQKPYSIEYRIVLPDSSERIVHERAEAIFNRIGRAIYISGTIQDITEHKKTEEKLKESEQKYRNLTEQSLIGVAVIQNNAFKYVNQRYAEIGGYTIEEMMNWQPGEFSKTIHPVDRERVMTQSIKKQRGDKDVKNQYTFRAISKTGETIWIELYSKTIVYESRPAVLITIIDISDRKKAEQKLIESEEKYRNLVENAQEGVWAMDENNDTIFVNPKILEMLGYTKDEMMGKNLDLFLDDTMLELTNNYRKRREKGLKDTYYLEFIRKDGIPIYTSIKAAPILGENGEFKSSFAYITDITDRKKAEQKLKESKEKFRKQNVFLNNILESLTHPFYVINADDYTITLTNSTAFSEGLEDGRYCYSITHKNDKPCEIPCKCPLDEVKKTKKACVVEHTHYDKEGNEKIYEIYGYPIINESGNVVQMIEYTLNITDRKRAENDLRKIAHQWRTTFDAMSESVFLLDLEQNILQCNKATLDILGKEKYDEIIGHSCCEVIHGTNEPVEWCPMVRLIESSHKESSIAQIGDRWCEIRVDPVINDEGILIGAVHIIKDITERRKTEQKLIESEEKFRTIAERTLMGIIITQDNQIKYINDALLNMFEYSQKEIADWEMDDLTKLIHSEDLQYLREYPEIQRSSEQGEKPYLSSYRVFNKSGKIKWIDQFSKEILYRGRSAELVTIIDITEKKKVEHELIKLNNIKSELLRRTSHELRTPLVSIKGFSDLLLELHRDKLDDYVIRTIKQIRMGCNRLESIVNDILKTAELESGTVELKKSKEDLSLLIKICVSELEGLSELRNHTINLEIPDKLIYSFEKEQMYNVITNILSNAIKFTPYNGKIEVKSEVNNGFIIISIKDNGIGFSKEERSSIFKQFGKIERYGQGYDVISEGSGLGLYISKRIIELHGGEIWLESDGRDKGSTFYFSLPII